MTSHPLRLRTVLPVALAALALPATAGAATWTQVTGIGGDARNTDEIGLARTSDGVLHVAWTRATPGTYDDVLLHSAISKSGKSVTGPTPILGGMELNNSVDLLRSPDGGLRVLFAGLNPAFPIDSRLATATAGADGAAWAIQPTPASNATPGGGHPVYAARGIGGGLLPAGIPMGLWGDSDPSGAGFNVGLSSAVPDGDFSPACCELGPDVATGADGVPAMAWTFLGDDPSIRARVLPSGPELTAPGSQATELGPRVAVSGRTKGSGVYVAYTAGEASFEGRPAIWRIGASKAVRLSGARGVQHTRLSAGPQGRMWVFWERSGKIYARRSNTSLSRWGSTVKVSPPSKTNTIYALTGEGSSGPLDVLALADRSSGLAYWHRRILPGLSLSASPTSVTGSKGGSITFRVTDAGSSVKKAKVSLPIGGKTLKGTTNSKGRVTLTIPKGTKRARRTATATKSGYTKATRRIRIK